MNVKPLDLLKKGLDIKKKQIQPQKKRLEAQATNGRLSVEDENWLDTTGNLVDDIYVIDVHENLSNYSQAFENLEEKSKCASISRDSLFPVLFLEVRSSLLLQLLRIT